MPRDQDIDAGYSGPGGGGYAGNPRGESSGFSGGGWNSVTEGGGGDRYRRRRGRSRLPAEYADFKLADGRTLREVLGDRFFGAGGSFGAGKWISQGVRKRLGENARPLPQRLADWRDRAEDRRARAEARRAERQARIDEWRRRAGELRASHPRRGFTLGGGE